MTSFVPLKVFVCGQVCVCVLPFLRILGVIYNGEYLLFLAALCCSRPTEWNSVESGPDGSEAAGSTDGNASDKHAGREGETSSTRSSSSSRPSRTSDGSASNSVHVQFEGEQVRCVDSVRLHVTRGIN